MPKVSVIVPFYNVEQYIGKCLESLANQTLEDIEIILVNDGSQDSSKEIAMQYTEKYPNKIVYLEKPNGGLSDARNYGMKHTNGDYIAFLDSDDYVELNTYEKLYNKAIETGADMVECDFYWEYPNKKIHDQNANYKNESDRYANARVVAWNKLYKREVLLNSNIEFPKGLRYEDVEFFYKILPQLNKMELINEPLIHYIQRENSITYVQNERTGEIFTILGNIIEYYKQNGLYEKYSAELEYMYTRIVLGSSLKRIVKIPNKTVKKELLKRTINTVYEKFPNWKKNRILKESKGAKALYLKSINRFTFKIYSTILK